MSTEAWAIVVTVVLAAATEIGALIYLLGGLQQWRKVTDRRLDDLEDAVWPTPAAKTERMRA